MIETFRGLAQPWHCDVMGHLNTRHYMSMFDDAGAQFLGVLLGNAPTIMSDDQGWADVKITLELIAEVPMGHLVLIRTGIVRIGTKSITYRSEMTNPRSDNIHAIAETVTVRFDLATRTSIPLSDDIRKSAAQQMIDAD